MANLPHLIVTGLAPQLSGSNWTKWICEKKQLKGPYVQWAGNNNTLFLFFPFDFLFIIFFFGVKYNKKNYSLKLKSAKPNSKHLKHQS